MNTHSTGLLSNAADRIFNVAGRDHHQVGEFVDHDQDERQAADLAAGVRLVVLDFLVVLVELARVERLIEASNVTETLTSKQFIAAVHLATGPCQCIGCFTWVSNRLGEQMRNPFILRHLDHLWIDQNHTNVGRGRSHQN